ncbi:MAG: SDR family oxidoreductase [Chloroflexi bacterium]|nr:SDR family oxidoreductase [Chloroflexota bacterium]
MKVLFIGGTGVISSQSTRLAVERGINLTLFNRGRASRSIPPGVRLLRGDIRDIETTEVMLGGETWDAVVDWVAYTPEQVSDDIRLFRGRTGQYVFISSASVYQTPPSFLPITESTPLVNPYWQYSRLKIASEERLLRAYRAEKFPMTIVRPSHTYDETLIPIHGRYTVIDRMRRGEKVIVHGDGTSLWALTHSSDFAKGFLGLLGNSHAIGETFHITSDELITWDQIYLDLAQAAGVEANLAHIPSEVIAAYDPEWGASLLGDKTYSKIFDNTKVKRLVPDFSAAIPFSHGAREIIAWYDADPARRVVDESFNQLTERILLAAAQSWPAK